jgi:hypothetical protein
MAGFNRDSGCRSRQNFMVAGMGVKTLFEIVGAGCAPLREMAISVLPGFIHDREMIVQFV